MGWAIAGLGRVALADDRILEARVALEDAWQRLLPTETEGEPDLLLLELRLALAEVTWRSGGARARAIGFATEARRRVEGVHHPVVVRFAARVDKWLQAHRASEQTAGAPPRAVEP
ncbi:MAG: hypothetical protein IAG13_24685 [Deltaproteobacteria bacterium]|nr:hypothetical protein [Nannocystaceae bacterium]